MSIDVVGDYALMRRPDATMPGDELLLLGPRGIVARWHTFDPELRARNGVAATWLAEPARLAILRRDGGVCTVDVIDVVTGQRQHSVGVYANITRAIAWLPAGEALLVRDYDGPALLLDDGRKKRLGECEPGWAVDACFSQDGERALVRFAHEAHRIEAFDLVDGTRLWSLSATAQALVASDDLASFAIAHSGSVESFDVDNTELRPQLLVAAGPDPTLAMWRDAKLGVVAVRSRRQTLRVFKRAGDGGPGSPWLIASEAAFAPVDVDVERGLALVVTGRGGVEVRTLAGVLLASARPSFRACLAFRGDARGGGGGSERERVAAALVDGAVHILDASGVVTLVEGPTHLVDLAPHARGVLAVDDQLCAHVIELAP